MNQKAKQKTVLIATTKRNPDTFEFYVNTLKSEHIFAKDITKDVLISKAFDYVRDAITLHSLTSSE